MTQFELLEYFYNQEKHMATEKQIKEDLGYDFHSFIEVLNSLNMRSSIVKKYGYSSNATTPDIIFFQLSPMGKDRYIHMCEEKEDRLIKLKNDKKALRYSKISLVISFLALFKDEVRSALKYLLMLLKQ